MPFCTPKAGAGSGWTLPATRNDPNGPVRVTIVEDDSVIRNLLKWKLTAMGYLVAGEIDTGEEAIDLAGIETPDLMLMDIALAGEMDGIQAAWFIKQKYAINSVFISGFSDPGTLNRAWGINPAGFVPKPIDDVHLHLTIELAAARAR